MWSIGVGTGMWIAGTVISKMSGTAPSTIEQLEDHSQSLRLDALKAIRESAYQRWERRRNYEWQLSISIWTALAAFSAVVISKDFQITARYSTAIVVALIGFAISWLHRYYVLKMFEHTIADVHIQRWAEKEIYKLAFAAEMPTFEEGFPGNPFYPPLSKYGRVQAVITLMLACAAVGSVLAPRTSPSQPVNRPPTVVSVPNATK
jgi:hypothetical protein